MAWLTGYSHRKKITVQTANLDAGLTDFPLLVKIAADADIGAVCRSDGYDVRFTSSDEETEIAFERESFAVAVGAATGVFFVKTSLATSPATEIYVYYGKASATDASDPATVWAGYKGVYHLGESYSTGANNYQDVSSGAHHATLTDADADSGQADGPIRKAVDLNGDADYLSVADHADHDPGGAMTIEAWVRFDEAGDWSDIVGHDLSGGGTPNWGLVCASQSGTNVFVGFRGRTSSGDFWTEGSWQDPGSSWLYFVGTFDRTLGSARAKIYRNGALDKSDNAYDDDILAGTNGIHMGVRPGWGPIFDGAIAEVRYLPGTARSAAWIKFSYYNITEADNELTWGAEEDIEAPTPEPSPAPTYAYADFADINAGTVFSKGWRDERFTLGLRDLRDGININLPEATYSIEEFPAMDASLAGNPRPFAYGTVTNQVANRINATDGVFEFHNGRCKTVAHVWKNADTELTVDTDCFIDYQRGRVVLAAAALAAWTDSDVLTVDFTGWCNTADEAYTKAADVYLHLHMNYAALGVADMNTDAIYKARLDATEDLAFVLTSQTGLQDITRILERSVGASSYQDGSGRLGLRVSPSAAPGNIVYIKNAHVFDLESSITLDSVYSAVVVKHSRNPQDDTWSKATKAINRAAWDYRKRPALEVETYLTSATDALALALEIVARLEKPRVGIEVPGMLFGTYPGDVVYLSRDRYPSASGTAANVLMRVMKITKSLSENKTIIEAEEV